MGRTLVANGLLACSACGGGRRGRPLNAIVRRHLNKSRAWAIVAVGGLLAGAVSMPVGAFAGSVLASAFVALVLCAVLVILVSRRVPNMLDARLLFIPGVMLASFTGAVAYVLVLGMLFK